MKAQLKADAEVDFLTKAELDAVLEKHFKRISELRFRKVPYSGRLPVTIGSPESGFMWSVRLASVVFDFDDRPRVYTGEIEDSSLAGLDNDVSAEHVITWDSNQCVLFGTQGLIVTGAGAAKHARGMAIIEETPVGHEWKL